MWMLVGVPIGLIFSIFWSVAVDTSPTLTDEDRIRGWGTVVRELPATVFLVSVPVIGLLLAVRAGTHGRRETATRMIGVHGVVLFLVLLVVMNGSAENIMTTRPSTVKWFLLPAQIAIAGGAVWWARRLVGRGVEPEPR
jgi:hypothetical protein